MNIPDRFRGMLARAFPSLFLPPDESPLDRPIVHYDHPVRIDGVTYFTRGDRTDAEFRAFIKETLAREDAGEDGAS